LYLVIQVQGDFILCECYRLGLHSLAMVNPTVFISTRLCNVSRYLIQDSAAKHGPSRHSRMLPAGIQNVRGLDARLRGHDPLSWDRVIFPSCKEFRSLVRARNCSTVESGVIARAG